MNITSIGTLAFLFLVDIFERHLVVDLRNDTDTKHPKDALAAFSVLSSIAVGLCVLSLEFYLIQNQDFGSKKNSI